MNELRAKFAKYNLIIADKTRNIDTTGYNRQIEILEYLCRHPEIENFVILDDYYEFPKLEKHYVHTNEYFGLTEENMRAAIAILNS